MHKPSLSPEALNGLAGSIVKSILPHTEADEAALLSQLLTAFGSCIGRSPHFVAEADRHGANLFVLNVGNSSKGRKGSSWGHIARLFEVADKTWLDERVKSGLSSGEGLIAALEPSFNRDEAEFCAGGADRDKRLLCLESEFGGVLKVMSREGNILSPIMRNAWDGKTLSTMTKNSPLNVKEPHVSIIGHITKVELLKLLSETEILNGLGNRFLFFCVERSKVLPEGGSIDPAELGLMAMELKASIDFAKDQVLLQRDVVAKVLWGLAYPKLSHGKMGLAGALSNRAEAQVMRLALLQALINRKSKIDEDDLQAALAIHKYCEQSLAYIFGHQTGNILADRIYEWLSDEPTGLKRSVILDRLNRHSSKGSLNAALQLLQDANLVVIEKVDTGGRAAEIWIAAKYRRASDESEISPLSSLNSQPLQDFPRDGRP